MTIKVSYTSASPVYINIGYGTVDGGAVWGDITGTLSNQADLQAALNAKVPYSGATGNVNLGEYELKAGQFTLDTSPTGTATVATMRWNDTTGLTETTLKGGSVVLKNGVDLVARVVNKVSPNTTLTKAAYQAVRVSGAQGQRLAIELAQANNDNNSADTIGLVTETIATNQEGFIMTVGQLEGINTTGSLQGETWVDGDVLYLSPTTAGALTNVKPVAPQHLVIIGYVEYAHANNGKIYVKVMNGWELGELHDVNTTGATNGSVLKYNGSIWVPSSDTGITTLNTLTALSQSFATGTSGTDFNISSATSTHTFNFPSASATNRGLLTSADWTTFNNKQNALTNPVTGTGVAGQVAYWSGTGTQTGSNNLFWDATNNRLGVNTNAPYVPLQIGTTPAASLQISLSSIGSTYNSPSNSGSSLFHHLIIAGDTPTARGIFASTRTRGTITSPTAVLSGDTSVSLMGLAFDGTTAQASAVIQFEAEANASTGSAPQLISFVNGSTGAGRTTKMQLRSNGNLILQNGGTFTDSGQRLQVTGDGYFSGSVGIGTSGVTSASLTLQKVLSGTNLIGIYNLGQIQSTNGNSSYYQSEASTSATAITVTNLRHFFATTSSFGAGSAVTNQFGFAVQSSMVGATNNYGFYGDIASGTGRWNIYMNGTADNYLAGSLGIGATTLTGYNLRISRNLSGATTSISTSYDGQIQSGVTTAVINLSIPTTAAALALGEIRGYQASLGTQGAGTTITTVTGFLAHSSLTQGTANYGFYGDIASGTGRWNLYMNGTAANFTAGQFAIGHALVPDPTGAWQRALVVGNTGANKVILGYLASATNGATIGANNSALNAWADLNIGGSNIIFRSGGENDRGRIHSSGNWLVGTSTDSGYRLDVVGTFRTTTTTYLCTNTGNTLIGTATDAGFKLDVNGTMRVSGASTFGGNITSTGTRISLGDQTDIVSTYGLTLGSGASNIEMIASAFAAGYGAKIEQADPGDGFTYTRLFGRANTTTWTQNLSINNTTGAATFSSSVTAASYTINDAGNITIGTTTGTKIGTATSQKIGFWNATPIVQPTTAVAAAAFVANTGTAVNDASTFDGYTMAQVVKALRNAGLLA